MSTPIAPTLLCITLTTGFPTLSTSVSAVAYDKQGGFSWSDGWTIKTVFGKARVWSTNLKVQVRFFAGIVGPAYAVTMKPSMSYVDNAITTSTSYTYCQTVNNVKTCNLTSNTDKTGEPGITDVVEKVTKHLPRIVTVDTIAVYGGFCMGTWLYLRVE